MIHFPRKDLANQIVDALSGKILLSDAANGLFLAAPRRTGKTTFLRFDLMPALEDRGILPIYVDLWENKERDPGELICEVIGRAGVASMSVLTKVRKSVKGSVNMGPVSVEIDPNSVGKADGASIPDVLKRIRTASKKKVCLIVDEAQHALTSEAGVQAMAALKSARDQMNQPGEVSLMLVMSGSDRDKLLRLVNTNAAPFYGSNITRMPALGADFVVHLARDIERSHPELGTVDAAGLATAFDFYGQRPQFLISAINETIASMPRGTSFNAAILAQARKATAVAQEQMASTYCALPALQQAVLWWMFTAGSGFRPYDAKALAFYKAKTGKRVTAPQVQQALERLRERADPLVWKSARGEYSVDDTGMIKWFEELNAAGKWPPTV